MRNPTLPWWAWASFVAGEIVLVGNAVSSIWLNSWGLTIIHIILLLVGIIFMVPYFILMMGRIIWIRRNLKQLENQLAKIKERDD